MQKGSKSDVFVPKRFLIIGSYRWGFSASQVKLKAKGLRNKFNTNPQKLLLGA